jgi:ArsR family transcriptional regulator, lead/cadmium/zinc/bismuth-responsive transcriptional repressor
MHFFTYIMRTKDQVKFFAALGDKTRMTIVQYLLDRPHNAGEFNCITKKDQTTNSRHLKVLKEADIIKSVETCLKDFGIKKIKSDC